jgi:hypothetical protein
VSRWHPAQRTRSVLGSRLRRSQHWDDVGKSMVFFGCENGDLFYGINLGFITFIWVNFMVIHGWLRVDIA